MKNRKGIVCYVDATARCITEFTWLFKTYQLWKIEEDFDLIVYHNPSAILDEFKDSSDSIIFKPQLPRYEIDSFWNDYKFVNSFAMFIDENEQEWINDNYDYILKTDADVFLTHNIKGYVPDKFLIGEGAYIPIFEDKRAYHDVMTNLERIRNIHTLSHNDINHVGASCFGKTETVIKVVNGHYDLTKWLLKHEFNKNKGEWPGWFYGVASMYAIHLTINHFFSHQSILAYALDSKCWDNIIGSNTIHIHAWQGDYDFNKYKVFNKEYDKYVTSNIPTIAKDYCIWIATNDLEDIMKMREEYIETV